MLALYISSNGNKIVWRAVISPIRCTYSRPKFIPAAMISTQLAKLNCAIGCWKSPSGATASKVPPKDF